MRKTVLGVLFALLLAPVRAQDEDDDSRFVDGPSGLRVNVPDGWDRDDDREGGSLRFAAKYDVARGKYIQFEILASNGQDEFDWDAWLSREETNVKKLFKTIEIPFKGERVSLGDAAGARFTIAGKREAKSGTEYGFRYRRTAVLKNGFFFAINEMSYNGAHAGLDGPLKAMYDGISFQSPGGGGLGGGTDSSEDGEGDALGGTGEETAAQDFEDKTGNFHLKLPAGWQVVTGPIEDATANLRLEAHRRNANDNTLAVLEVYRFSSSRPETFTLDEPVDVLENLQKNGNLIERFYGKELTGTLRPEVNSSKGLGSIEKTAQFEYRSILAEEEKKIDEAETLKRRGEKNVMVPTYKPVVVRGRLAMLSPYIYFAVVRFNRSVADNDDLVAEYNTLLDSWEFSSTQKLPPFLSLAGEGTNTRETQKETLKGTKVIRVAARKVYRLEVRYAVPPGLMLAEQDLGENFSLVAYGQDARNNWVRIEIQHENANRLSEQNKKFPPPKQTFGTWKSNWESKARSAKIPRRAESVNLGIRGLGSGKGYRKLDGKIEGHRGTFTGYYVIKKGWRTIVTIETRGRGDEVFAKEIKALFRSLKIKPLKK